MYRSILALFLVAAACHGQKSYDGWSLFKVHPDNTTQVDFLNSLREKVDGLIQVWQQGNTNRPFDIFMSPKVKETFKALLEEMKIKFSATSNNVQQALDAEKIPAPRNRASTVKNGEWFTKFLKYEEIMRAIDTLVTNYPSLVKTESIGKTHQGRPITVVTVGGGKNKPAIWLDGGIHAREWASPATVLFILNKLVTTYNTDANIKALVDGATWYIVPVLNPDGYVKTHTVDRMWRKNARPRSCSRSSCCDGVDLNRNFGYGFGGAGTSPDSCDDTHRGPSAFSEPESQAVRNFILNHKDIKAYLTIHAYSQMWFYPFGDKVNSYSDDVDELADVAQRGADALRALYGTRYDVGTAADLLYEAAGGSDDWAKGVAGIKYVYCLELRPEGDAPGNGFILPPNQIVPTAEETWAGLSVVARAVLGKK
jgi:hypothetical protein